MLKRKFIEKKGIDSSNIAVALNETLVKKSEWNKLKYLKMTELKLLFHLLEDEKMDKLLIDGISFESRLIMGTFPNIDILNKSLENLVVKSLQWQLED